MDPYGKATSSITHNLKDPPPLLQLSDLLFDSNQVNMNDSISETEMNGCDVEMIHTTAEFNTNVTLLSSK